MGRFFGFWIGIFILCYAALSALGSDDGGMVIILALSAALAEAFAAHVSLSEQLNQIEQKLDALTQLKDTEQKQTPKA